MFEARQCLHCNAIGTMVRRDGNQMTCNACGSAKMPGVHSRAPAHRQVSNSSTGSATAQSQQQRRSGGAAASSPASFRRVSFQTANASWSIDCCWAVGRHWQSQVRFELLELPNFDDDSVAPQQPRWTRLQRVRTLLQAALGESRFPHFHWQRVASCCSFSNRSALI